MTIIEDLIAQDNSHLTKVYAFYKQGLYAKEASQALEYKNAMNTTVNYYVLLGKRNSPVTLRRNVFIKLMLHPIFIAVEFKV